MTYGSTPAAVPPGAPAARHVDAFRDALDRELATRNEDYAERRVVPTGLRMPLVEVMPSGASRPG